MEITLNPICSSCSMMALRNMVPHCQRPALSFCPRNATLSKSRFSCHMDYGHQEFPIRIPVLRKLNKKFPAVVNAITPGVENVDISTSASENFAVVANVSKAREIKMKVVVSGAKTQKIFDEVFSKLVEAAQPIPGFRRVKGVLLFSRFLGMDILGYSGKTPDIPKHILLQILGPSKVYGHVIREVINSTVAEYVEKEELRVTEDLRVDQSFEELEASFEPGNEFSFDGAVWLHKMDS
ncbi:uncharacterized protein LOC18425752 isoform X2 [Amborella trichopoda]|uniref:uncharacterized protein LOC18425752 isoform X2 n=1 Tax=Amborella trichopoda TaxID=13333 RepID=UPI0009BEAAEF|nr:uncharacterized protein LOC18425752 isoform X2 [Amborella trichopoda]|eukprot:XP_020517857.1 uncharacterized protein LOC18425752 isoform X2 [Amborella trichopoda]